jgi:ABC-type nitrate/sulfonate/bicarbonate transport system permease component
MSGAGWIRLVVIALPILLLELACRAGYIDAFTVIAPSQMAAALLDILSSRQLLAEIAASLSTRIMPLCRSRSTARVAVVLPLTIIRS